MKKNIVLIVALACSLLSSCAIITDICAIDNNIITSDNCELYSRFYSLNSYSYDQSEEPLTYSFFIDVDTNIHWYPEIKINSIVIVDEFRGKLDTLNIIKICFIGSENHLLKPNIEISEIDIANLFYDMEKEYKHIQISFETNRKVKEIKKISVDLNFVFDGKQYDIKGIRYKKCSEIWSPFRMISREN